MRIASPLIAGALLLAAPAGAHSGGVIAKATFVHPAAPIELANGDGGSRFTYVPEDADQSYHIEWKDGGVDPTAKFTFYYLDHGVSEAVSALPDKNGVSPIQMLGTPIYNTSGRAAADLYVSCTCAEDAGVVCPDVGSRHCEKYVEWDTSHLPDGTYWIAAVNDDPPYHVYNLSLAPVRVAHGPHKPPAVIVLKPDGFGSADESYRARMIVVGTPPITADLAWGHDNSAQVQGPTQTIAKGVPVTVGADGTWSYLWDTTRLPNDVYFLRVTLHDAGGAPPPPVYSDSRYGLAVYHRSDRDGDGAPADANPEIADAGPRPPPPSSSGCSCAITAPLPAAPPAVLLAAALFFLTLLRRRSA